MAAQKVVIFGATGFVGSALTHGFLQAGFKVVAASRHGGVPGLPGQVDTTSLSCLALDIGDSRAVAEACTTADIAINLCGILAETGQQSFDQVHVQGAQNFAKACVLDNVPVVIHFSALGASPQSKSRYAQSKYAGEQVVRKNCPHSFIFRPSIVAGKNDGFFFHFAKIINHAPVFPVFVSKKQPNGCVFAPVLRTDVVKAAINAAKVADSDGNGGIYELYGSDRMPLMDVCRFIAATLGKKRYFIKLPYAAASVLAAVTRILPQPPITADQVEMLQTDNVPGGEYKNMATLGVTPQSVTPRMAELLKAAF